MRFLGIGDSCDLGALYARLVGDGHEVRVFVAEPLCRGTLAGIVPRIEDWTTELDWIREAGPDGIILFENVAEQRGSVQDGLRAEGFNVIGGSALGDRLENDRAFAQEVLGGIGLSVAGVWAFDGFAAGLRFIRERPSRYVLKFNGPGFASHDNYVGRLPDGHDVAALLEARAATSGGDAGASFILMERVEGVEMGVGAYFNGRDFLRPACLDWEHKRFFPGDLGELTGEMGTVATFERTDRFFDLTLARMAPLLAAGGYLGYINLNTIVNGAGIWPLEFTCRFGYPGFAVLDPLQATSWAELFGAMVTGSPERLRTRPGFSVGVVMTTPPFPYTRREVAAAVSLPVMFEGALSQEDKLNFHHGEVGLNTVGGLVTSGIYGWTAVVTGTGPTIPAARERAYGLADRVLVPNLRYRRDIGARLIASDFDRVERLGLIGP